MSTMRRKDLKPAREISDARFLAGALASATKAQKQLERRRRAELVDLELGRSRAGGAGAVARPKGALEGPVT
jgi:hypothetical protein